MADYQGIGVEKVSRAVGWEVIQILEEIIKIIGSDRDV